MEQTSAAGHTAATSTQTASVTRALESQQQSQIPQLRARAMAQEDYAAFNDEAAALAVISRFTSPLPLPPPHLQTTSSHESPPPPQVRDWSI